MTACNHDFYTCANGGGDACVKCNKSAIEIVRELELELASAKEASNPDAFDLWRKDVERAERGRVIRYIRDALQCALDALEAQ